MAIILFGVETHHSPVVEKLAGYLNWLNRHYHLFEASPPADAVPTEISAVERAMAREMAQIRRIRRKPHPEPVTREEKILDLSG